MPPLKAILFIVLFALFCGGALLAPIWGVLGYVGHYSIGPERQWWAAPFRSWGIRYSYTLALLTAVGMVVNWGRLRFGKSVLTGQEKLILLLLGIVWLTVLLGDATTGRYTGTDHPSVKFTKIVIFAFMLSHVVTDMKNLDRLLWVLVIGALILGLQAYDLPRKAFVRGRLNTVGGPDFRESNVLSAYLAVMLPLIGVMFYRCKAWIGKGLCLVSGVFATNAIVLTRSRGALVGLGAGALTALFMAPKRHRVKIVAGLIVAAIGGFYLTDEQFRQRAITIDRPEEQRDRSAQSRIEIWRGGGKMLMDHPMGVGAGNFYQSIGRYAPNHPGRDAHNTFVRCAGELGWMGISGLGMLILNGFLMLRSIKKRAKTLALGHQDSVLQLEFGLTVSLATLLACGMTITLLYTEFFWWLLVLPVCLVRVLDNIEAEELPAPLVDRKAVKRKALRKVHARVNDKQRIAVK